MAISQEVIQSANLLIQVNQFNRQMELERAKFLHEVEYQDRIYKLKDQELKLQVAAANAKAEANEAEQRKKAAEAVTSELKAEEDLTKAISRDSLKRLPENNNPYRGYAIEDLQSLYRTLVETDAEFRIPEERVRHDNEKKMVLGEIRDKVKAYNEELASRNPGDDPMYDRAIRNLQRYQTYVDKAQNPGASFPAGEPTPYGTERRTQTLPGPGQPKPLSASPVAKGQEAVLAKIYQMYQDPNQRPQLGAALRKEFDTLRQSGATDEQIRMTAMELANRANALGAGREDIQNVIVGASVKE